MSFKGKRLRSGQKAIIMNVREYFESEKAAQKARNLQKPVERTAEACKVGKRTVSNIYKEFTECGESFSTPSKRYKVNRSYIEDIDDFDTGAIRRAIHAFYSKREIPTLDKLLIDLKEKGLYEGKRTNLWCLLKKMGFRYKKRQTKKYIYEQPRIILQRHQYLRKIRKYRSEGRPLVFLDETWLNAHHTVEKTWVDKDGEGGLNVPSGKGRRLIILHAGSAEGWINNAELVFEGKKTGDYHECMDGDKFQEWLSKQLIPNIPPNSVIVMDNATYHNVAHEKCPTKSSTKRDMMAWLDNKGIVYDSSSLKAEIFQLIEKSNGRTIYKSDVLTEQHGHIILRLPIAHCELNPIELCWAQVKGHVARHNKTFKMADLKDLAHDGLKVVTAERWQGCCRHVCKVEEEYWQKDGLIEEVTGDFCFTVNSGSSDESESNSESGSEDEN